MSEIIMKIPLRVFEDASYPEAMWCWSYLTALGVDFDKTIKTHLREKFNLSTEKLIKILKYLKDRDLIQYYRLKENGKYCGMVMRVLHAGYYVQEDSKADSSSARR